MFLFALAIVAMALAGISWIGSNRVIHPKRQIERYKPEDFALLVEDVTFLSADDILLSGWFVPGHNGATVILLHGYGRSRGELLPQAAFLYRAGYSVLLFDFRHRGSSGGDSVTLGAKEPLDVFGALHYLQSRPEVDPNRIGVMGVSLGASVGIIAAAVTPGIKLVIAEGAFQTLRSVVERGMRSFIGLPAFPFAITIRAITERRLQVSIDDIEPENVIGQITPRPVMLIHGVADEQIPFESARTLYWRAKEPKIMWLVSGAPHAVAYQHDPQEFERRVLEFLEEHL